MGLATAATSAETSAETSIVIAIGSNRPHGRHGRPAEVVRAAVKALGEAGFAAGAVSPILATRAMGPGGRDYANAVMTSSTRLAPPQIVAALKAVERSFGRRGGRRWGARVLDLDLITWGDGVWPAPLLWRQSRGIAVPHRAMHTRAFVLAPMLAVAADWKHPVFGLTVRQMRARLRNG
ncbi:2-amino-4-hydroxy-6-hydroxymethyldihydropteridine diphosphokinase [Sphingosinicella soli]|uniref:2-amino-4-hydroxy-6-hydroxymethyldihydropteridine pyrophosphokinase n=1 Tax=Sphingosinicella soli TaxID=333708 RepID=A0A7W7F731_9SPHN|nr:2-amino-4-hydroxy-6-hydroxymethyldihydropteridine diphosphokinase [Sphingosinicella soli]MBB4633200.1 2-amino-4-hydroxy-6-hydroxymethyldihydropteridine diphosphokinase [Sphingosinicella soli]